MERKIRTFRLLAIAATGALVLTGSPPVAAAAPFVVTKTADTADGTCSADCSLREAITAANNAAGTDTITVPAGTYVADAVRSRRRAHQRRGRPGHHGCGERGGGGSRPDGNRREWSGHRGTSIPGHPDGLGHDPRHDDPWWCTRNQRRRRTIQQRDGHPGGRADQWQHRDRRRRDQQLQCPTPVTAERDGHREHQHKQRGRRHPPRRVGDDNDLRLHDQRELDVLRGGWHLQRPLRRRKRDPHQCDRQRQQGRGRRRRDHALRRPPVDEQRDDRRERGR